MRKVDLSPLLADIIAINQAQQDQINDLIERIEILEDCACGPLGVGDFDQETSGALLFQNVPNPFDNSTRIGYFIPMTYTHAVMTISTTSGKMINTIPITRFGEGHIDVNKDNLASAVYFYTLYVDGKRVDTKRMVVE